ncbi:MAG: hydrolase [Nitrospiraceae bacterium]|nr:hydrolase [Nitrospiraceae bacterium]
MIDQSNRPEQGHLSLPERFLLDWTQTAMLIVDVQEKLAAVMDETIREKVLQNILRLTGTVKVLPIPVILTEQYPKGLGPTVDSVKSALPGITPVEKITFDCCGEPSFINSIQDGKKKKILLAGMETHICVLQTCLGLLGRGFTVHVVSDACCSRKKGDYKTGIEFMRDAGAVITSVETALFQLAVRAGTEEFKAISGLIK